MKSATVSAICILLLSSLCAAQQNDPKFKAETRLVLVPAVVKDSSGKFVPGLSKDAFKLMQDGKEQPIAVFEEVHTAKTPLQAVPTQSSEFGNSVADVQTPRSYTVIVMDLINTPPLAIQQVKQDLLKYIGQMADNGDPTSLVALQGGNARVIYDFTTNPKQLAEAVRRLKTQNNPGANGAAATANAQQEVEAASQATVSDADAASLERQLTAFVNFRAMGDRMERFQQAQNRRDTLNAMRSLATALRALPGRKSLIWVTGGYPFSEDNVTMEAQRGELRGGPTGVNTASGAPSTTPGSVTGPGNGGNTGSTGGAGSTGGSGGGGGRGNTGGATSGAAGGAMGGFSAQPLSDGPNYSEMGVGPSTLGMSHGTPSTEAINDNQNTWGVLNDANISVYPVDARYMSSTFDTSDASNKYSSQSMDRELAGNKGREIITTFENMASATGGTPCYNRTNLDSCFRDAVADNESYYMLGFYLPVKTKEGWHKLQVKADNKDLKIRARNGFTFKPVADQRAQIQSEMLAAVASNMNSFAVPFTGSFLDTSDKDGKKSVRFEIRLPWKSLTVDSENGNRLALDIAAVAFDSKGQIVGKMGQTLDTKLKPEAIAQIQQGGLHYRNTIELPPGDYQVRFIVRDNLAERLGSTSAPLKVQ